MVDGPGFSDVSGISKELVHSIGFHDILINAKSIKILIAMEANPITTPTMRGSVSKMILAYLESLFINKDFSEHIEGIIPVILRADPRFDLVRY